MIMTLCSSQNITKPNRLHNHDPVQELQWRFLNVKVATSERIRRHKVCGTHGLHACLSTF